jgi:FAD dependent oxidoreductase TIGR03364
MSVSPKSVVVVGGGVIGTMHAYLAAQAGYQVTQIERDLVPQSASVRNFGLIWVSGREAGAELDIALRARELWAEIGAQARIGFRPQHSITIAQTDVEFEVMSGATQLPDAGKRGFEMLSRNQILDLEPSLQGSYIGGLLCTQDAAVEPSMLLGGLRDSLTSNSLYQWIPNFEVVDFYHDETGNHVTDINGQKISSELIVFCPGAAHKGFLSEFFEGAALRKVHLQMGATEPLSPPLKYSIADADSMRYYPAFKDLPLEKLPPQSALASELKMQLLMVQRLDGSLTIGDTHDYVEPFNHELLEAPYDHLTQVMRNILGRQAPRIARRWDGVYSQCTNSDIYFRKEIAPGAVVVTGGGGRGNSISPAVAEETMIEWSRL